MKKMNLKPAKKGLKVFNPKSGKSLSESGELVILDKYWRRRYNAGEVVECKPAKAEKKVNKKEDKKKGDE